MAIGAVFLSLPTALIGAVYYSLVYQYGLIGTLALYSALGFTTMLTVTAALAMARVD